MRLRLIVDGAGRYNDVTGAAPELPEWKANLNIGWSMGNHNINTITRYIDSMPYDGPQYTFLDASAASCVLKIWTQLTHGLK